MARAAQWASGVDDATTVTHVDAENFGGSVQRIRDAWRAAGRTEAPHISASLWYSLGEGAEQRLKDYAYRYLRILGEDFAQYMAGAANCFTDQALRAAVKDLESAGCDELFLVPTTTDVRSLDATREILGV